MPEPYALPVFGINHILAYGQSLATGWEGVPALTRRPRYDALMLGRSVRAGGPEWSPAWEPLGGPVLLAGTEAARAAFRARQEQNLEQAATALEATGIDASRIRLGLRGDPGSPAARVELYAR